LNLNVCEEGDVAIANADKFDMANGYVFALGELTLKLKAVWADMLAEGAPAGVEWSSSNARVATVDENGIVTAKSVGQVRITASKGGKSASVLLNVQNKVVSMQLRTSNYSFVVGLARETVFAAEKYVDATVDNTKIPNSKQIEIVGAPLMEEDEDIQEYKARLAEFYGAYSFKVVGGSEYATIGGEYGNTLTFIPSALDGKGRQIVTVEVSAKYPKYENSFTHDTVDVNVIYGVEVTDDKELRAASADQREYAFKDGNLIDGELVFEHFNTANGRNDRYRVYNYQRSKNTYAIAFADDVAMDVDENGKPIIIGWNAGVALYGDVYGNNHKFYAESYQLGKLSAMFVVRWSGVTISNLNMRANGISDNGNITSDETTGFTGQCVFIGNEINAFTGRINDTRIEYCIMENTSRAVESDNADVEIEGSIMRNISNAAVYANTTMRTYFDEDGVRTTYPHYTHLNLKNNVFSNCLATIGAFGYETYTYMPKPSGDQPDEYRDYDGNNVPTGVGRFVRDDLSANARYFRENFESKGINTSVNQTGFIDVYNWQNIENANLVGDLGSDWANQVVTAASGSLLKVNETFSSALYRDKEDTYLHMGFIVMGM
ncbi:MAG: Ig-like domain-containing protein, partial [Clostridia bacterium]|nr:Ig-like domain-containing protein [Clostridia bacterium]